MGVSAPPLDLLEEALLASPAIAWIKDLDGRYLTVNDRYAELLSTSQARVRGHTDAELNPREAIDGPRLRVGRAPESQPLQLEYIVEPIEGRPAFAVLRFAVRDTAGEPIALCGVAAPLSEAHVARAECAKLMRVEPTEPVSEPPQPEPKEQAAAVTALHNASALAARRAHELMTELSAERTRAEELERELAEARARLAELESAEQSTGGRDALELEQTKAQLGSVQTELERARAELTSVQADYERARAQLSTAELELADLGATHVADQAELGRLGADAARAREQSDAAHAEAQEARAELQAAHADADAARAELQEAQTEAEAARSDAEATRARHAAQRIPDAARPARPKWSADAQRKLTAALAGASEWRTGLRDVVKMLGAEGGWDAACAWVPDDRRPLLLCGASWVAASADLAGFETTTWQRPTPISGTELGRAFFAEHPTGLAEVEASSDERLQAAAAHGIHSALLVPIRFGRATLGVLELLSSSTTPPDKEIALAVEAVALQLAHFWHLLQVAAQPRWRLGRL